MRRVCARAGVVFALVALVVSPVATGCYAPRIESCRGALDDFSTIGAIEIIDVGLEGGDHGGNVSVEYRLRAASTDTVDGSRCVAVHSELWQGDTLLSTIDTPITAQLAGGVLTTSLVRHYRTPVVDLTVRVTALGATIEVAVDDRLSRPVDAGASGADAGAS